MTYRASLRAFASALFLAGAVAYPAAAQPKQGGNVIYANLAGPGTLDPYMSASLVELEVIHEMYEGLVAMDGRYQTQPMLATRFDIADDAKTFTFTLRHGVKFHNGKEMTSADVLASYERYRAISPNAAALGDVKDFQAPDPYSFVIHLNHTNAVFVELLKSPVYPMMIMPAEQKDKPGRSADVIGTGPFKLDEWIKDSHLVLRRFDGYAANTTAPGPDGLAGRRTVYLDTVRFNFLPEANARLAALQSGAADVIADIPGDLGKRLDGIKNITEQKIFPYCQSYFIVNTQQGPTMNPLIRQAIGAVVNVDDINAATGGITQMNSSMVYSSSPFYAGADYTKPYYNENDPTKARALLTQAGYKGEKITLQTNSNYAAMRDAILVLSEQMKAAGMNVDVSVVDWTTNAANMQQGTGTWNVSTTSFCSNPLLGPQQWKVMIYGFPHVKGDALLDHAYDDFYTSLELDKRKAAWMTIEKQVLSQAYMIKVADQGNLRAYNDRLVNFTPYYMIHFWDVSVK